MPETTATNPFDNLEASNPFDNLTPSISDTRQGLVDQLHENPSLVQSLFSLTKREVGGQGPEAQQAFMESVFNRAAARGQTLQQTVQDASYYPRRSLTPTSLSNEDIDQYGSLLKGVAEGSNISNYATGNASGTVGFNGGQETSQFGGERFGIEGPDVGKVTAFVQANPESSQLPEQKATSENPFDDLTPATPEPLPTPEVAQTAKEPSVMDKTEAAFRDYIEGMIPHSVEQLGQAVAGSYGTNPIALAFPQLQALEQLSTQGLNRYQQIQEAEQTPALSQERFNAGIGTVLDLLNLGTAAKGIAAAATLPAAQIPTGNFRAGAAIPPTPVGVRDYGRFAKTYAIDKELGDMIEKLGASRESGAYRAEIHLRNMLSELNKQQREDFGKYLVSRRLNTLNPQHSQVLPPQEMARIEADPKIQRALDYYRQDVKPEIEAYRKRAGLSEEAAAGKEAEFISLMAKEQDIPKGYGQTSQASRVPRRTRFAQAAEGKAPEYHTDISKLIEESFNEVIRKARIQDFLKMAEQKGLALREKVWGPQGERKILQPSGLDTDLFDQFRLATERPPQGYLGRKWETLQRAATGVQLSANPAEVTNHMRRQLNVMAAKPPVGMGVLARLEAILPYIGPKTGAFLRVFNMSADNPLFQSVLRDVIDAGGGSSRAFTNRYAFKSRLAKWSGLKYIQEKTHRLLFGIPKGKGLNGWDLRMRVYGEMIRRAAERNVDPQRMRQFANGLGQYGSHPSFFIDAVRKLNPYAATTLPLRGSELKQMVGISGLKSKNAVTRLFRMAETQLRGTGGTILALTAANYLLSGKWPWENDAGHEFDLNTGLRSKSGKKLYLKLRVIAPELSRPINTLGVPALARERTAGNPQYLAALGTALANQGLAIVGGPAQNTLLTATIGAAPYAVREPGEKGAPHLLDVAKTPEGGSRGVEQLKRAAAGLNPLGESLLPPRYEPELPDALKFLERPVLGFRGIRPFGSMFTESYEKKKPKKPQTAAQRAATVRRKLKHKATQGGG